MVTQDGCEQWDRMIRQGRIPEVQRALRAITCVKVPRDLACQVANLAWRTGLFAVSIRVLNPIVPPEKPLLLAPPTAVESAEYPMALMKIGALTEARRILQALNPVEEPISL